MGLTVKEVIERTQSEHLFGGGVNLPAWTTLEEAVDDSELNIVIGTRNTPGGDDVLEFDDDSMELASVNYRSGTTVVLQERGYLESTAAEHAAGIRLIFNNPYPKHLLFQGLQSLISQLYSFGLYQRVTDTTQTYRTTSPVTLPADAKDTLGQIWVSTGQRYQKLRKGTEFEVLYDFAPIKIQFFTGGQVGFPLQIVYKAEFTLPEDVYDPAEHDSVLDVDLDDCGVPSSLQHELSTGLASRVLAGKDVPQATTEYVQRQLTAQASPVGTRMSVSSALWSSFLNSIYLERSRLMDLSPPTITYT